MNKLKSYFHRIKKNKFAQDSFWALIGNVAAKSMILFGAILVARFLGKDIYGEYGTIKSTLMNFAIFSTFGLGYTATKYIAEYNNSSPEILRDLANKTMRITLIVSSIMAFVLLLTASYVADNILQASHLTLALKILAIWIVFNALTTTQIGVLSGIGAYKTMARINIYVGVFAFISSVLLAYYYSLNGALLALLLTQILNWVLNFRAVRLVLPKGNQKLARDFVKEILKFSLPVAMQEGLYALTAWIMILLLIDYGGYGEVGLYSAAIQWSAIILFIPGILRNVILTHLSEQANNINEHDKVLRRTLLIYFIATISPFIIIWAFMPLILEAYGNTYKGLNPVMLTVIFSTIFISLSNVYSQAFMSRGKNWLMFAIRLFRDLGIISLFIYLSQNSTRGALNLSISVLTLNIVFLFIISLTYLKLKKQYV